MSVGKVALVTGSRRGIGLGIARALGKNGYTVILSATTALDPADPLMDDLAAIGLSAEYIPCDIADSEQRFHLIRTVIDHYGRLDILVNNAGVAPAVRLDLLETTEESFDRLMQINLKGTFFMCQLAANQMIALQKSNLPDYSPRMVNISSVSAYAVSVNRGEYCISKAGVAMTTQLFADRLAEFGIPVFEVRPGIILTDMTAAVQDKYTVMIENGLTPIKRFGTPEDVANAVLAACSGLLDFTTGQVLNADGGFHIRRL